MGPKRREPQPQDDLFGHRLEQLLDHRHPLYRLAHHIPWQHFEREAPGFDS